MPQAMEPGGAAGTGLDDLGPMRLGVRMEQRATVKQQVHALRSRLDHTSNDLQACTPFPPLLGARQCLLSLLLMRASLMHFLEAACYYARVFGTPTF